MRTADRLELRRAARHCEAVSLRHRPALLRALKRCGFAPPVDLAGVAVLLLARAALRRASRPQALAAPPVAPAGAAEAGAHDASWRRRLTAAWRRLTGRGA